MSEKKWKDSWGGEPWDWNEPQPDESDDDFKQFLKVYCEEKLWEKQKQQKKEALTKADISQFVQEAAASCKLVEEAASVWEKFTEKKKRGDSGKSETSRPEKKLAAKKKKHGDSSDDQEYPPLRKGGASSSKQSRKSLGTVMIDWHNTLEVKNHVPKRNMEALIKLYTAGYEIIICSWCYAKTARAVKEHIKQLKGPWERLQVETTEKRTGLDGKVHLAKGWGVTVMFDDAADICAEGVANHLLVYPITSRWESHEWALGKGVQTYATFADAVDNFLEL